MNTGQLLQQDQAALLAALHDPSGVYAQQLLGGKDGGCVGAAGGHQHPTPRSSLDMMALGRSAYSSPRSSFEVPQVQTVPFISLYLIETERARFSAAKAGRNSHMLLVCTLCLEWQLLHASMFSRHPVCAHQLHFLVLGLKTKLLSFSALPAISVVNQHLMTGQTIESRLMCWSSGDAGDAMPFIVYRRCTSIT